MDKFCLIAIMLFAIDHGMNNYSVVDVINAIDNERGIISRADYLELVFSGAFDRYIVGMASYGEYDKYFDNRQFVERVLPF